MTTTPSNEKEAGSAPQLSCKQILVHPRPQLELSPGQIVSDDEAPPVWQCAFSRNGQRLAACYGGGAIRIWTLDDNEYKLEATLTGVHSRTVRSIAFAPIHSPPILASASFDGTVCVWEYDKEEWLCQAQLEGHDSEVKSVTWNATGSLLATCGRDKTVWIWEAFLPGTVGGPVGGGDYECLAVLNGHEADVKTVAFAPSHSQWGDGDEILFSACYDDTIRIWAEDAGEWYCAASIQGGNSTIWSLTVAPGGGRMVSGSGDGNIRVFKCYTETEKKQLFPDQDNDSNGLWKCVTTLQHSSFPVYSVNCAPARAGHGRIASGGGDNLIRIFREDIGGSSDQPTFSLDSAIDSQQGEVNCVCWHPWDGAVLASAGDDGTVRIWNYTILDENKSA